MHGADVNKRDEWGNTALIYVVESLVAQRCKRSEVLSPLSEETDFSSLKSILLAGGDVTMSSRYDGLSPLHIASFGGMCDLMMELIQHGANCNQLTSSGLGLRALDLACKNSHESAVVLLLENGANPDGKSGRTYSTRSDSYESHSMPPLCMAAKNGSKTVVDILLKYGANVNASSEKGDTALHLATSYAIIETLLNAKANVSATNYNGETALSALCEKRQADANAVELLLKHGADPNTGFPLHAACENNDADIVKLLLSYGADENLAKKSERSVSIGLLHFGPSGFMPTTSTIGPSPLCIACRNGNVAVVDCLLKKAADVAFADSGGNTALHFSIERLQERREQHEKSEECDPIVTLLLQHNAPVNVVSSKGETLSVFGVGPKRPVVDRSTSRSQNNFNLHDFPLHAVASRGLSARRGVARSLCTTWRRVVPLHHVASRGLWYRAVYLHAVASRCPSAQRGVARSLCITWHRRVYPHAVADKPCRAVPLHAVATRGLHNLTSRGFSARHTKLCRRRGGAEMVSW